MKWVVSGLRTGIKTTAYPSGAENAPGVTPGLPLGARAAALAERCPTHALANAEGRISVDYRRCVHCYRCARGTPQPLGWKLGFEWAGARATGNAFGAPFSRSI